MTRLIRVPGHFILYCGVLLCSVLCDDLLYPSSSLFDNGRLSKHLPAERSADIAFGSFNRHGRVHLVPLLQLLSLAELVLSCQLLSFLLSEPLLFELDGGFDLVLVQLVQWYDRRRLICLRPL